MAPRAPQEEYTQARPLGDAIGGLGSGGESTDDDDSDGGEGGGGEGGGGEGGGGSLSARLASRPPRHFSVRPSRTMHGAADGRADGQTGGRVLRLRRAPPSVGTVAATLEPKVRYPPPFFSSRRDVPPRVTVVNNRSFSFSAADVQSLCDFHCDASDRCRCRFAPPASPPLRRDSRRVLTPVLPPPSRATVSSWRDEERRREGEAKEEEEIEEEEEGGQV